MLAINLNADVGEGWGAWQIGDDDAMVHLVGSASVACGFHAGDWSTMHRACLLARETGCSIGAHPGYFDLWGFGRRPMRMSPSAIEQMVAYQIGALQAVAACAGAKVTHVKPHGALATLAASDLDAALAIGRAIRAVDRRLIYVAQAATPMVDAARRLRLQHVREGYADRQYADDLTLVPRNLPGSVLRSPPLAAVQAVTIAAERRVVSRSGATLPLEVDTLCIHGDEPTGPAVAEAVRHALLDAGFTLLNLRDLLAARRPHVAPRRRMPAPIA